MPPVVDPPVVPPVVEPGVVVGVDVGVSTGGACPTARTSVVNGTGSADAEHRHEADGAERLFEELDGESDLDRAGRAGPDDRAARFGEHGERSIDGDRCHADAGRPVVGERDRRAQLGTDVADAESIGVGIEPGVGRRVR